MLSRKNTRCYGIILIVRPSLNKGVRKDLYEDITIRLRPIGRKRFSRLKCRRGVHEAFQAEVTTVEKSLAPLGNWKKEAWLECSKQEEEWDEKRR